MMFCVVSNFKITKALLVQLNWWYDIGPTFISQNTKKDHQENSRNKVRKQEYNKTLLMNKQNRLWISFIFPLIQ